MTFAHMDSRYYCLSILDKHHHPDISLEQGMKLLELCTDELKRRLPIDFKGVSDPSFGLTESDVSMRNCLSSWNPGHGQGGHKRRSSGHGV